MCDVAHKALGISGKDKPCPASFLTTTQCETYMSFFSFKWNATSKFHFMVR